MSDGGRFYEAPVRGDCRSAPAALRNREPIAAVLAEWLPQSGTVLELASGTGEQPGSERAIIIVLGFLSALS